MLIAYSIALTAGESVCDVIMTSCRRRWAHRQTERQTEKKSDEHIIFAVYYVYLAEIKKITTMINTIHCKITIFHYFYMEQFEHSNFTR